MRLTGKKQHMKPLASTTHSKLTSSVADQGKLFHSGLPAALLAAQSSNQLLGTSQLDSAVSNLLCQALFLGGSLCILGLQAADAGLYSLCTTHKVPPRVSIYSRRRKGAGEGGGLSDGLVRACAVP